MWIAIRVTLVSACAGALACTGTLGRSAARDAGETAGARDATAAAPSAPSYSPPASGPLEDAEIASMLSHIDAARIAATIDALASIPTRHTCSGDAGIARAAQMLEAELGAIGGLTVMRHGFASPCGSAARTPANIVGIQRGVRSPERVVVIGGHYDSIGSRDPSAYSAPAPGANDSGSQSALVLEAARTMAAYAFDATIVYALFAGEEQGLVGSRAFVAELASLFPGATVEAAIIADIVGGDVTANTGARANEMRIFSSGTPRELGTESGTTDDTSPSRGLMRFVVARAAALVPAMAVLPRLREDRPMRGSDHMSFVSAGLPGVRVIEGVENLAHQHSPEDLPRYVSPGYVARVTAVVVAAAASLARATSAPIDPTWRDGALWWAAPAYGDAARYVLAARPVTAIAYGPRVPAPMPGAPIDAATLGVSGGAFFVSVAALGVDGRESLFAYPELRCDLAGACAVQPGSLEVTAIAR